MTLWWHVAVRSYRRHARYRGAAFAGVVTNTVFGFISAYVLLAVYAQRPDVDGFDATDAVTFAFAAQGFLMAVSAFGWREISDRVATGDVASDLYRPVDFQAWWAAHTAGRAAFMAVFRGIPPFVGGGLVLRLAVPTDVDVWAAFVVTAVLAVMLAFAYWFLVNLVAFWLIDVRGVVQLASIALLFAGGMIVPLWFLPGWLEPIVRALPFAAIVQLPVEVFLGRHGGADLLGVIARQVAWLVALGLLGRFVLAVAVRRLVVQGG